MRRYGPWGSFICGGAGAVFGEGAVRAVTAGIGSLHSRYYFGDNGIHPDPSQFGPCSANAGMYGEQRSEMHALFVPTREMGAMMAGFRLSTNPLAEGGLQP